MVNSPDFAVPASSEPTSAPFDAQAASYDRRVGFPEACRTQIVEAVLRASGLQPGELLVEVGAGTGQIGEGLARSPVRYLGFDLSAAMLAVFRERLEASPADGWTLLQADGNQPWPVSDGSARAIFGSRSIHLLARDAVLRECYRVAHPAGSVLFIGRVRRSPDGIKVRMQRQMRRQLSEIGRSPRDGPEMKDRLLQSCCDRGAEPLVLITAARWPSEHSPRRSLESWRSKPGLGGIESLPETDKQMLLDELEAWAIATFGDCDRAEVEEETYVLEGVRLPAR